MAKKIVTWTDAVARIELQKRLGYSRDSRKRVEYKWEENERTAYSTSGNSSDESFTSDVDLGLEDLDNSNSDIAVGYTFKNLRFVHAQLSANPPSVVVRPTSNDQDDRRKADSADRLVRHAMRQYQLQEKIDKASLNCLLYGTGFMKTVWDADRGDIMDIDEESGELTLEGDISVVVPSTWSIFLDPDAETWEDTRYVFERILIPFDEALFKFGEEKRELLEAHRLKSGENSNSRDLGTTSSLGDSKYDAVELYEYWETGLPTNGYLGRYCICTKLGEQVTPIRPNPFRFRPPGSVSAIDIDDRLTEEQKEIKISRIPKIAVLPYHIFTDIDIPDKVWGRSFIEYTSKLQDTLNRLDATNLDNIQANGVSRMVIPESAEISDESITNTPWDIVKITGNAGPWYMEAPPPLVAVDQFRAVIKQGIDDLAGVNESMFGQQSREQSGFSMQYATNQGNMIRRRLFNKYVLFVEGIYKSFLNLVRKHWTTERTIFVLGKEKAFEAIELKGADIDGGFDMVIEYGASLSLDPMTRREEIMALQPMFEKAGVPPKVSLKMMKLNELEGMYDMLQMAEDRQRELFEEMVSTGQYIAPRKLQDHENMLIYSAQYVMTTEFKYLEEELKILIEQHIEERAGMAAQEAGGAGTPGAGPAGQMPPGPAGAPGEVPAGPEMMPAQAGAEETP